ncbi:MAG: hypothetical protein EOO77_11805 [Oxalobacteraceae bacterium]|nr:MAG: hypothetical protein EOO77_11805 [Oxalobacteraceae bacterium]
MSSYIFLHILIRHATTPNPVRHDSGIPSRGVGNLVQRTKVFWALELLCCIGDKDVVQVALRLVLRDPNTTFQYSVAQRAAIIIPILHIHDHGWLSVLSEEAEIAWPQKTLCNRICLADGIAA